MSSKTPFYLRIASTEADPAWDAFLETLPEGCYQQSSLWASLKAKEGWIPRRITLQQDGQFVGGVQLFLKKIGVFGKIGFVPKGPVLVDSAQDLSEFLLNYLVDLARREQVRFLKLQPLQKMSHIVTALQAQGAIASDIVVTPPTTLQIDLTQSEDDILANMHRRTRQNIGRARRKGVQVKIGQSKDLPAFIALSHKHAKQLSYLPSPDQHYYDLWEHLAPRYFKFFVAEYEGQAIAARSNLFFGNVAFAQYLVDDLDHRQLNASTLLHWEAMNWAKSNGYHRYDFGGIKIYLARLLQNQQDLPDTDEGRRTRYKLSFGGDLIVRGQAYDLSYIWPMPLTTQLVPLALKTGPVLAGIVGGPLARYLQMHQQSVEEGQAMNQSQP